MPRLSFIVAAAFVAFAAFVIVPSGAAIPAYPITTGNFIDDYFNESSFHFGDEKDRADLLIKVNHAVPRYTFFTSNFSLTRVPARFCLPNDLGSVSSSGSEDAYSLDNCEWGEYAESLLLISFVAFIIAIIVFPFLFCGLSLGRCCCCGKWKPTPELCCGDPEDFEATTHGYTDCCVWILFVLSVASVLVMAGGAGVGMWGSLTMTDNVHDMANFTNETAYTLADIVDSVVEILRSIGNVQNISEVMSPETMDAAEEASDKLRNITDSIVIYADKIDLPRQIFMYVTLILPVVLMILVIIGRFTSRCPCCCWMPWGMALLGFILCFLSLVTFGCLYPLSSGIADICVFLDEAADDPDNDSFINSVLSCGPNSTLSMVSDMTNEMFETAGNVTCDVYDIVQSLEIPCDKDDDGTITLSETCKVLEFQGSDECNFETFSSITRNSKMYDRKIGCFCEDGFDYKLQANTCGAIHSLWETSDVCPEEIGGKKCRPLYCYSGDDNDIKVSFDTCGKSCSDLDLRGNSTTIMNYTEIAAKVMDLYNNMIKPYLNCESVAGITNRAKDFICVGMINSVTPMFAGEIAGAVGCFFGTFIAILSTKRFRRQYRRKYAIAGNASAELNNL